MNSVAGATTLGELATALAARAEEASIVADLKAGSEDAYAWLVEQYHQQIYNLVYRIVNDPTDAADATQEVFLKVFRGMNRFNGSSSLKTWMYRIAVHEAANQRRWWFRHKAKETSIEPAGSEGSEAGGLCLKDTLEDSGISPYEALQRRELRTRVEGELRHIPEPFRTTVVLRDLEELSYEEIAEVMETTLGTVKSRLLRGREALKQRLRPYLQGQPASGFRPHSGVLQLSGSAAMATASEIEVTS
jgi:RNA polymerase sigma-70 factor (ECF subfamily)